MTIHLDDDRIDAIRSRVFEDVDSEITARGRRVRRRLAGSVGALALVVVAGVAGPALLGSDPSTTQVASGGATMSGPETSGDAATMRSAPLPKMQADVANAAPEAASDTSGAAQDADREVITTGSTTVVVSKPADSASRFADWVSRHHGRVDGRSEHRDQDGNTSATLNVRLPANQVDAAIKELRALGEVNDVQLDHVDVTAQGRDLDARIKALKISVNRLEDILSRGATTSQVIEAESALSERQQELESLQSERRSLSEQVSLSTVSISFVAKKDRATDVAPGGFFGGLVKGWNALVDAFNAVVTAIGVALPWVGLGLVAGLLWWIVARRRRGHASLDS